MNRITKFFRSLFSKKKVESTNGISVLEQFEMVVKGNVNKKGEKIAHVPGGRFYDVVRPVETFNSVEEAEASGYRVSKQ